MLKSMFTGVTGLKNHQTMLDVIGNNIANVNTVGFKSSRTVFTDVYYQTIGPANAPTVNRGGVNPMQIGYGSSISSIDVLSTRSGFQQTYKPYDLYIAGDGYFVIQDAVGTTNYTRVGNFTFDSSGSLVDANGNYVCGEIPSLSSPVGTMEPIQIADYNDYLSIGIGQDGTITGVHKTTGAVTTLGQIALAMFPNPDGLSQMGNLYLGASANSGTADYYAPGSSTVGSLISGGLEMSNVDLSTEFTNMIIAQRGFQANSRVITTSDEVLQELVNLKR